MMNGIDIASHQAGIDLGSVPCDFVMVKATQGRGYINPYCSEHVERAAGLGKSVGVYHYVSGGDAKAEARFFVGNIPNWVGKHVLAVDWEENQNSAWGDRSYLEAVIAEIISLTGIRPLIYAQASVYPMVSQVARIFDCGLWVAQYANDSTTGYQENPWNEDKYGQAMLQYSSHGRLPGWGGNLDLNKFYGNTLTWNAYASGSGSPGPVRPVTENPVRAVNVHYALRRTNGQWLTEVLNNGTGPDGFAGMPCDSHDLLYAWVDRGKLRYRVHTTAGAWLPWVDRGDPNDMVHGCAGNPGEPIDGVQFYYETEPGEPLKQAWYRSQTTQRAGWLPVCCDDGSSVSGFDGWAGIPGEPLDRLQVVIADRNPF